MTKEEYIGTVIINDIVVNIGMDDYGQSYFGEYIDQDEEAHIIGCGTYNLNYLEEICTVLDYKGCYISLYGEDGWEDYIKGLEELKISRPMYTEKFQEEIDKYKDCKYQIYDFKKMYEELEHTRRDKDESED